MATVTQVVPRWRRLNWWKIGFIVALLALELLREAFVLESAHQPAVGGMGDVYSYEGYTVAEGRLQRIDAGDKLFPTAVHIQCDRSTGKCIEATAKVMNGYLFPPEVDTFDARFGPDAIAYENTSPMCVRYETRIDLRLGKVFSIRERNANKSAQCNVLERRLEMTLAKGPDLADDDLAGHFLPMLQGVMLLSKLL